ncbi:hypothetical protein [Gayadomonas joobiniege]|uniref:hypothetical protein n=1 Tax=Gayadomonas joobiniege TaxID=1234606 RepID=UPI0012DE7A47|nr:hypothetical protein [Gayadomonas joobiniege]
MFKQKVWLGLLGLFFFPFTYYHAFVNYSGNRKRISAALLVTTVLGFGYTQYQEYVAEKELTPFFKLVSLNHSTKCQVESGITWRGGTTLYNVSCNPKYINEIEYTNEEELISKYREFIVQPLLKEYSQTFGKVEAKGIKLIILSPSRMSACYIIENPNEIVELWSSFEYCD